MVPPSPWEHRLGEAGSKSCLGIGGAYQLGCTRGPLLVQLVPVMSRASAAMWRTRRAPLRLLRMVLRANSTAMS